MNEMAKIFMQSMLIWISQHMKNQFKQSIIFLLIGFGHIALVQADQRFCAQPAIQSQKQIIKKFYGIDLDGLTPNTTIENLYTVAVDINEDGNKDLLYSLNSLGGSCGSPGGIVINLGDGQWQEVSRGSCYLLDKAQCWIILHSSHDGFRDIVRLDQRGKTNYFYKKKTEKYQCKGRWHPDC